MDYECMNAKARKDDNKYWTGQILSYAKRVDGFEAEISGRGSSFHLVVRKAKFGNYLCIPMWDVGTELADCQDTFWNCERLKRQLSAVDSITIANGIKAVSMLLE